MPLPVLNTADLAESGGLRTASRAGCSLVLKLPSIAGLVTVRDAFMVVLLLPLQQELGVSVQHNPTL